jgi:hypothetical protein
VDKDVLLNTKMLLDLGPCQAHNKHPAQDGRDFSWQCQQEMRREDRDG